MKKKYIYIFKKIFYRLYVDSYNKIIKLLLI